MAYTDKFIQLPVLNMVDESESTDESGYIVVSGNYAKSYTYISILDICRFEPYLNLNDIIVVYTRYTQAILVNMSCQEFMDLIDVYSSKS
jgi:hypothetical protein